MLIIHADIHTMAGPVIPDGFIRVEDGKIAEVGKMASLEEQGECVDVQGARIYPGFIDAHTHLGMWEDGLDFEGDDGNEDTDPVTPHLRAIDAINPLDRCFREALEAGVTTVVSGPGSANPIGGQMVAMKTFGTCVDQMMVKMPVAVKMALGENPKNVYHGKNQSPVTRMATAALIREQLFKARAYREDLHCAETSDTDEYDPPEFDIKCEALLPVLKREVQVHFHAHRADDIFTAIRLGKEFHLDFVIVHATDGHLIADALKQEQIPVLSGPFLSDRSKPELRNLTPKCPGILSGQGVPLAIVTDHPVIPVQYLPLCAGLAVREGMDSEQAIQAITCNPAKICKIDHRVGSIEPGKDADLVVFRGSPLDFSLKPEMVFVNGKRVH